MDTNRRNFLKTTSISVLGMTLPFPVLTERKGNLYDSRGTLKSFKYMDVIEYRDGKFVKHPGRGQMDDVGGYAARAARGAHDPRLVHAGILAQLAPRGPDAATLL